jgi:2,3-bisphosphoglycerate-independent phosphoglycerate mutase
MKDVKGVVLVILDGWGVGEKYPGNAIELAKTPFYDQLLADYPNTTLAASGLAIGLPEGQIGTSEVNHMIIGAGKILYQDLTRINENIRDGSFANNPELNNAVSHAKEHDGVLHLLAMVGPGGVHSHQAHLMAILDLLASTQDLPTVCLHLIADGRDVAPESILTFLPEIESKLESLPTVRIASLSGRYFSMDRDHNWDRTDKALAVLTRQAPLATKSLEEVIHDYYAQGVADEFFPPVIFGEGEGIKAGDAAIFVNFRSDRTRQLTERITALTLSDFYFVTMTQYEPHYPVHVAFPPTTHGSTLGQALSEAGLTQYRITETEKFAHLTFFFNCKREEPYAGETRVMLESYKDVATHDQKPYMKAAEIVAAAQDTIASESPAALMLNICNADMVGHSGNMPAIIEAVETVDQALADLVPFALEHGYAVLVTADHGNAEEKIDKVTGGKLSAHTLNPVPYIQITSGKLPLTHESGQLSDLAPTILTLLNIGIPADMTGQSFVERT